MFLEIQTEKPKEILSYNFKVYKLDNFWFFIWDAYLLQNSYEKTGCGFPPNNNAKKL